MPVFPNRVPDLVDSGPIIEVVLFPPQPLVQLLRATGKPIPSRKVVALIDTGASGSCIEASIARELEVVAHDVVRVHTAAGLTQQPIFDIGFSLPTLTQNILQIQALGANLEKQPYDALIGRDVLSLCTLIYNGWDNSYQLHI